MKNYLVHRVQNAAVVPENSIDIILNGKQGLLTVYPGNYFGEVRCQSVNRHLISC